jgi:hypothetical protein
VRVSPERFIDDTRANLVNAALLARLPSLGLNQCYLTAGCLFQAAWNRIAGLAADWGVKDYDVFYFDDCDLSWEAEDAVFRRVLEVTADLAVGIEVKNQARVHLWYPQRFNAPYPRLMSSRDGIDRYLVTCTCVGIEVVTGELYAPNGLADVYGGVLRMNPANCQPAQFLEKAKSYQSRWSWLRIVAADPGR